MKEHPTRIELFEAAQKGNQEIKKHISSCEECSIFFNMIKQFKVVGSPQLNDAPAEWLVKAQNIAQPSPKISELMKLVGEVIFDSWSSELALGVRGSDPDTRRIQLEAEDYKLDLHASRESHGWSLTARWSSEKPVSSDIVLYDNTKEIYPDNNRYLIWNAQKPPTLLKMRIGNTLIQFPRISWRIQK